MMKQIGLITMLWICLFGLISAQPGTNPAAKDEGFMDTTYVKNILVLSESVGKDSAVILLERAVYISKEIGFDPGADAGFSRLIGIYHDNGEIASEMRTRMMLNKYLEDRGEFVKYAANALAIGDLFFSNLILSKAADAYRESLEKAPADETALIFRAEKKLGKTLHLQGKFAEAEKYYNHALAYASARENVAEQLWLMQQKAEIAHQQGQYEREFSLSKEIFGLAGQAGLEKERLVALNNLGYAAKYAGKPQEAESYYLEVLAGSGKDAELQAEIYQSLGILKQSSGDVRSAIKYLHKAAELYQAAGKTEARARVFDFLSLNYYQQNDAHNALEFNKKAIDIGKQYQLPVVLQSSYLTRSMIHQMLYEYESALEYYKLHLALKDSVDKVQAARQSEVLQQQFILERMEKETKLFYVNEDIKNLEISKLRAEKETESEKLKRLQKESELQDAELANQELKARQALSALRLLEEQQMVEKQKSEILTLNQQKQIQELQLNQEKLKAEQITRENEALEKDNQIKDLEIENQKTRAKNLILTLGGLALFILIIVVVMVKLRTKNRKIARQNLEILENQKIIEAEKEKSENLLLNILPAQVAAELKETGTSVPRNYKEVSVLFTDFVGFTQISEQLSPVQLVETLDKIFLEFDIICEKHGLNRIKTIGDAYLAACGLPEPAADHALCTVRAGIAMRDFISEFNRSLAEGAPQWNIRIGIHSGEVMAGVVGIRKFAFDIWGDTVNIAARMESSGEAGKVNVSKQTHLKTKGSFHFEHRGKVKAKNKGSVDMYFVELNELPVSSLG